MFPGWIILPKQSFTLTGNNLSNHHYDFKRRVTKEPITANLGCEDYNGGVYLGEQDDFVASMLWPKYLPNLCPSGHF